MNIFVLDKDPFEAARSLCDAHVLKMTVESCQLLSTQDRLDGLCDGRYKMTHIHHPCRRCLESTPNRVWLQHHLFGLAREYEHRFGKIHKSEQLLRSFWLLPDSEDMWSGKASFILSCRDLLDKTSFPQCMPEELRSSSSDIDAVVQAYRRYYTLKKQSLKHWRYSGREEPNWLNKLK